MAAVKGEDILTKEQLEQLADLRQEIKELKCKIVELRAKKFGSVTDKVKASGKNFPYIQGSAYVTGFDSDAFDRNEQSIEKCIKLLTARKQKAEKLELEITEYINSIENSRIRRMMQFRYIEGYTWRKISKIMHCDRTTVEKTISKFLSKK